MFEFLFKYPASVFAKGRFVLLGGLPVWLLIVAILIAAAALAFAIWKRRAGNIDTVGGLRSAAVWLLQTLFITILLFMLWHPAVSVATLKPQQNVVAVVIDDSRSMALNDGGMSRREQVIAALKSGVLSELQKRFQVRLYRAGAALERIESLDQLNASVPFTRLGDTLRQVVGESASLPVGAVLLLSDGADNAGGIDLATMDEIRRQHIPIHTIGFGREQNAHDIEVSDAQLPARTLADTRITAIVSFHQRGFTGRQVHVNVKDGGKALASQLVTLKGDGIEQTEAISFNVNCETQEEIDYFWEKLSADGGSTGSCGWLKDKFGLSWQVTPLFLVYMLADPDVENANRVMKAIMEMGKIDIAALNKAAISS